MLYVIYILLYNENYIYKPFFFLTHNNIQIMTQILDNTEIYNIT